MAKVFDAEDAQRGAFRGRLKHFRKLGIPAKNPGKGSRLQYSASDLFQLLVALELSEFNIDPNLIVKIVLGQRRVMQSATAISQRSAPHPVETQFVWASGANLLKALQEPGERFCVFNLSARIRAVNEALAVE